jgi:F0F1-type ATP synthase alpha subunit
METDFVEAINNKNLIELHYDNQLLVIEPHCYGICLSGKKCLVGYQVETKYQKLDSGWRIFYINKANDVNILEETFLSYRCDFFIQQFPLHECYINLTK